MEDLASPGLEPEKGHPDDSLSKERCVLHKPSDWSSIPRMHVKRGSKNWLLKAVL